MPSKSTPSIRLVNRRVEGRIPPRALFALVSSAIKQHKHIWVDQAVAACAPELASVHLIGGTVRACNASHAGDALVVGNVHPAVSSSSAVLT